MCAVTEASLSAGPAADSVPALERSRCKAPRVARKPRHRKLNVTNGSNSRARRKSACAGRSRALNRLSRSHIGRANLEEPAFPQPAQRFDQVGAQQSGLEVDFREATMVHRVRA